MSWFPFSHLLLFYPPQPVIKPLRRPLYAFVPKPPEFLQSLQQRYKRHHRSSIKPTTRTARVSDATTISWTRHISVTYVLRPIHSVDHPQNTVLGHVTDKLGESLRVLLGRPFLHFVRNKAGFSVVLLSTIISYEHVCMCLVMWVFQYIALNLFRFFIYLYVYLSRTIILRGNKRNLLVI